MSDGLPQGTQVGEYEVLTRLAVGGLAELYLARRHAAGGFQKLVALKMIHPELREDERFVQGFLDEAKVTAELNHPNLAQVYDLGQTDDGTLFLAMEFIAGHDLSIVSNAHGRRGEPLPVTFTASVMREVCLGLHAAHTHRAPATGQPKPVIHRDVAPKNVMVTFDGQVKVIDFGLALTSGRRAQTRTGVAKGTPTYLSPERVQGQPATPRSDVFSVGVTLHEALTGYRLFPLDLPLAQFKGTIRPPSALNPKVPKTLDTVCLRAVSIDPDERFPTALEFARALAAAVPQLADADERAQVMRELFPTRHERMAELVKVASQAEPPLSLGQLAGDVFATRRERPVPPAPPPLPASQPGPSTRLLAFALVGTALVGATVAVLLVRNVDPVRLPEAERGPVQQRPGPPPPEPPRPTKVSRLAQGEAAFAKRAWAEALEHFDAALVEHPDDGAALLHSALALRELGQPEASMARLERAAALPVPPASELHVESLIELSTALATAGRPDEGVRRLGEALEADPTHTLAYVEAHRGPSPSPTSAAAPRAPSEVSRRLVDEALTLRATGRYIGALAVMERCIELEPTNLDCIANLASTYARRGGDEGRAEDQQRAIEWYRRYVTIAPAGDPRAAKIQKILDETR